MGSSVLEILKQAASETGELGTYTTTSAGSASTLVCSGLINTNLPASYFEGASILVESGNNAGAAREVRSGGLARSTGTITTAEDFTNSVIAGVTFSVWGRMAPYRRTQMQGYLECLNTGLPKLSVRDVLNLAGTTDLKHYPVDTTTYPWFTEEWRIIGIQYPVTNADDIPRYLPRNAWEWVADGETKSIRLPGAPFKTGETAHLVVYRPANSRLKLNGRVGANLTAGAVSSVTVSAGGYYTAVPTVTASSGAATFTAVLSGGTSGTIGSVTVTSGGSGYGTTPPTLTVTRDASDTGWRDQTTQTAELVDISDETIADVNDAVIATKAEVYRTFAESHAPGAEVAVWNQKADEADRAVRKLIRRLPEDPMTGVPNLQPTRAYVPRGRRGGGIWWTS